MLAVTRDIWTLPDMYALMPVLQLLLNLLFSLCLLEGSMAGTDTRWNSSVEASLCATITEKQCNKPCKLPGMAIFSRGISPLYTNKNSEQP